jgi:transcriptional regulator with XRE-family HTH domain
MEPWIAEVVGKMHVHKISQDAIAERVGVRREHINKILNGKIAPKGAAERITVAVDELIAAKT